LASQTDLVADVAAATRGEEERLAALEFYSPDSLVDDAELTRITEFAANLCEVPIALVSLVEEARQRFLARKGLEATETGRDVSFCTHAMFKQNVMVVPDATKDPRFVDNTLVTGPPYIRFYGGAPLVSEDGHPLGALCVISPEPREGLTDLQTQGLEVLAAAVMRRLRDRRREIAASWAGDTESFRILADSMPQIVWSTLPDGYHDYYNERWYEFTGVPRGSTDGDSWNGMFHPEDQEKAWARWRHSLQTGEPYEIEYRLRRADGEYRWTLGRALPMRAPDGTIVRWFGTCTEIHEQKLALESRDLLSRELNHRIKNIFALVSGLIALMTKRRPEYSEFGTTLQERLVALARAHDLVNPLGERSQASLCALLEDLFEPWTEAGEQIEIHSDEDVDISQKSVTPLALLFHELATNAAKYGALSDPAGRVRVEIRNNEPNLEICWTETGGPPVKSPDEKGFGSELLQTSVSRQLKGEIAHDWSREGLRVRIQIPLRAL